MPAVCFAPSRHRSACWRTACAPPRLGHAGSASVAHAATPTRVSTLRYHLGTARQLLDQPVEEILAVIVRLDEDSLIAAVGAIVVRITEQAGDAVSGNADGAQVFAVRRAGAHRRDDENVRADLGRASCRAW